MTDLISDPARETDDKGRVGDELFADDELSDEALDRIASQVAKACKCLSMPCTASKCK